MPRPALILVLTILVPLSCCSHAVANVVYQSSFDSLDLGQTQKLPGNPGHDGWFVYSAPGSAFGEIQDTVAIGGRGLHEFAPATNPPGAQTIDGRFLSGLDITQSPNVTLSIDFYAHSSDLSQVNNFLASFGAFGSPSNTEVVGFQLRGGNGAPKQATGVNVYLSAFNGSNNNEPIVLTVGQNLTWDAWHHVSLSVDPLHDRFISLTVDGQTQGLGAFQPARNFLAGEPVRGTTLDLLLAQILPDGVGGTITNDDVYWDNVVLIAVPEPSSLILATTAALIALAVTRRRLLDRGVPKLSTVH